MNFEKWLENCTDEELNEIMDSSDIIVKKSKGYIGKWEFTTKNNNTYTIYCSEIGKDIYDVLFTFVDNSGVEVTSLTNLNDNPTKIFNTVYETIRKEIIEKRNPKIIQFEANGDKRIKIYNIIMKRYIEKRMKKYGYIMKTSTGIANMKVYKFIKEED